MNRTPRRVSLVAAVLALLALATIGTATAFWTGTGTGSRASGTGTALAVTLTPATPSAQLYPDGKAAVVLSITNPNPGSVRVEKLALDTTQGTSGFAVDAAHTGCGLSSLSFTTQTTGWTVPGSGSLLVTLANSLSMTTGADNACQGASLTVYLQAGP